MKKILFVIPDLGIGGTNPSLESLFHHIKMLYDIKVFAISHQTRSREYLFDKVLLPQDKVLSLLFTDFDKQHGFKRFLAFLFKSLNIIFGIFGFDLRSVISRKSAEGIESADNYDCVVAYQEGFTTRFVSYFHNSYKVAWVHCNYDKWLPKEQSEEWLYRKYRYIVCVSSYTADVFANRYPALRNRIVGIHNFVEKEHVLSLGAQEVDDIRFKKGRFNILSVGRFHSVKRFSEIPSIAADLIKKGGRFFWYIIGNENDDKEFALFNENIQKFKVSDYVIWLGGKSNPYPYFRLSDLFVCTSESEACPMVFIEAKLFGTPIISTDFPSAYEFINNDVDGVIAPLNTISNAIYDMMTNDETYKRIKDEILQYSPETSALISKIKEIIK